MNDPNNNVVYSDVESQKLNEGTPLLPKGQSISEEFFLAFRYFKKQTISFKVHIFCEGHKILRNLHQLFDWQYIGQIIGGDFAKLWGLLRICKLYKFLP